jgi:hypothetical protein
VLKKILLSSTLLLSFQATAAFNECIGVYVGRISITNQGMDKVVFLQKPTDGGGSYWVNFASWDPDAKKEALSILMAAKLSQHRVDLYTTATDSCSIGSPGQTLKEVHLSTNP